MKKSELLNWLQQEYRQWQALLDRIGPVRMDQPGEFFDQFHDDHEADMRAWLERTKSQSGDQLRLSK
jgi:hypothetical protein